MASRLEANLVGPPAHNAVPSRRRIRKAINALPSSRFMPIQSQPTASGCM
jgi:hypothetical protein